MEGNGEIKIALPIKRNTLIELNKPVNYFGLPAPLFLTGLIIILITTIVQFYIGIILFIILFILSEKMRKTGKEGNPDMLTSFRVDMSTPISITDENNLLQNLETKENE